MFGRLAHLMYRRRWYVIGVWLAILAVAFTQATQVGKVLGPGDFTLPGSDSQKAASLLDKKFHESDLKTVLVILHSSRTEVTSPSFKRALASTTARIRADTPLQIQMVANPLVTGNPQLVSHDQHSAAILVSSK